MAAPLAAGRTLRPVAGRIVSALAADDAGALYDRHARIYDRLIGNRVYNRVVWGTLPGDYTAFAGEALGAGVGPLLDVGCGTLVFTAAHYATAEREVVLVDRSVAMLKKAAERLPADGAATLVQADLHDLPFAPASFATVACHGVLHVLEDPWAALRALGEQVAPGGRLFASMLVTDRGVGRRYLGVLERAGEVGPPRSSAELAAAAREVFGAGAVVIRTGSMAWLRAGV
jgi:SAM-dependent methyltransferase